MLGKILMRATGHSLEKLAGEYLFTPLRTTNYRWAREPDGSVRASGFFETTPRDMAKLGQVMLDGGTWKGRRIVSESWVRASVTRQTALDDYAYGFLWHLLPKEGGGIMSFPVDAFAAAGQGGQLIVVAPELRLVVVTTAGNFTGQGPHLLSAIKDHVIPAAMRSQSE